jgi:DNA-binding response OmpR family regulator
LPDMDGIQVLREIRKIHQQVPVILLTGHGTMSSALDAIHLEATDFLLKPVKPDDLLRRTKEILRRQFVVRRKQEIQAQIDQLQTELHRLDTGEEADVLEFQLQESPRYITKGLLQIDLASRRVTFGSKVINLPPTTFDYLVVLASHSPDILGYQQIVAEAQGFQVELREAKELSKWHIYMLRKELEISPANPQYVLNIRGKGYRLLVD